MYNLLIIPICITIGLLLKKFQVVPPNTHKGINIWLIYIALPAVSLKYLQPLQFNASLLIPTLTPILALLVAFVISKSAAKICRLSKENSTVLFLVSGLCNTSFVGFPLVSAYFGEENLATAVICDQITFLLFSTVGMYSVLKHSADQLSRKSVVQKVLLFPPLIACAVALLLPASLNLSGLLPFLSVSGRTIAPLALLSIGLQLQTKINKEHMRLLTLSVLTKLVLVPAAVFSIYRALELKDLETNISIFETAMPTLLSLSILTERYQFKTQTVISITGISILLSFVTTFVWQFFLK